MTKGSTKQKSIQEGKNSKCSVAQLILVLLLVVNLKSPYQ